MDPFRLILSGRGYPYRQLDLARDAGSDRPRLLVLAAESVVLAERLYQLEALPGEPGEASPIRVFRATTRIHRLSSGAGQKHVAAREHSTPVGVASWAAVIVQEAASQIRMTDLMPHTCRAQASPSRGPSSRDVQ